ncbi:proteasome assembly chaperone 4 isoform X2 [Varanus komodoensis]|uniref:proteasome assembly chaperone 4 isoform X2 n=1 Tax=Varanus komodoensis TaxID=61221 RepID=UPI001CF76AB0|nr:proteasome assembly chaperone 4 isoform X2 [Varanus komodoensis]
MEAQGGDGAERLSTPAMPAERARISLHNFHGRLAEQLVHFHAMRLKDSLFLWIGDAPQFGNLAVAMCTPRDSIPASTLLTGDASDTTSISLAQRLDGNTPLKVKAFEGTFQHYFL